MAGRRKAAKGRQRHESETERKRHVPFWPFGLFIFALLVFLDQYTKRAITEVLPLGATRYIFPSVGFSYVQNTGAAWSMLRDSNAMLIWLSVIAFGLLIFFYDKFDTPMEKIAYTLLLAGLWGNLLDRVLHGFVIDFIAIGWWPRFNIADSCITVGIVIFLLEEWRRQRTRTPRS